MDMEELISIADDPTIEHMLTTVDNPYNPFTDYKAWYAYDIRAGHHTVGLLGRIVSTSDDMSEADQALAREIAIDEIVTSDLSYLYKKVSSK